MYCNYIITIIAYAIFKENSHCKFEKKDYRMCNILAKIKSDIEWYDKILEKVDRKVHCCETFRYFCNQLKAL